MCKEFLDIYLRPPTRRNYCKVKYWNVKTKTNKELENQKYWYFLITAWEKSKQKSQEKNGTYDQMCILNFTIAKQK